MFVWAYKVHKYTLIIPSMKWRQNLDTDAYVQVLQ